MTLLRKEDGQSLQKMLTTNLQKKRPFFQLPSEIILFPLKADNNVHFTQQLRVEKKKAKTGFVERIPSL
jgi:hypothetical protein